jgi:hypothetical protein
MEPPQLSTVGKEFKERLGRFGVRAYRVWDGAVM